MFKTPYKIYTYNFKGMLNTSRGNKENKALQGCVCVCVYTVQIYPGVNFIKDQIHS